MSKKHKVQLFIVFVVAAAAIALIIFVAKSGLIKKSYSFEDVSRLLMEKRSDEYSISGTAVVDNLLIIDVPEISPEKIAAIKRDFPDFPYKKLRFTKGGYNFAGPASGDYVEPEYKILPGDKIAYADKTRAVLVGFSEADISPKSLKFTVENYTDYTVNIPHDCSVEQLVDGEWQTYPRFFEDKSVISDGGIFHLRPQDSVSRWADWWLQGELSPGTYRVVLPLELVDLSVPSMMWPEPVEVITYYLEFEIK